MTEVLRLFWMLMWISINVTAIYAGSWLWRHPFMPGGEEWPFGGGVLFIGLASTLFWMFVLLDMISR